MEQHPQLLVYKASAGSGKTFTLAVHYIRQLIEDPYAYRRILAVTFTNKATAEMKERILEQLYGIATADEGSEGYLKEIQKTSTKSVEEIRESAREALRHIIHDYSRFRIETIDSFFQSVMRNLARELELGANLSIELNNTEVLSDAVDAMIASVGGIYVEGAGTLNGSSSIDFLRDEQALGNTRGASVESVMKPLWAAYQDPTKKTALMQAVATQYLKGNIVVEPEALFVQFALANGITKVFT